MELWLIKNKPKRKLEKWHFRDMFILSFHICWNSFTRFIWRTITGQKEGRAQVKTVTEAKRDKDAFGIVICDGLLANFGPQNSNSEGRESHKDRELCDSQIPFKMFKLSEVERDCHFAERLGGERAGRGPGSWAPWNNPALNAGFN